MANHLFNNQDITFCTQKTNKIVEIVKLSIKLIIIKIKHLQVQKKHYNKNTEREKQSTTDNQIGKNQTEKCDHSL